MLVISKGVAGCGWPISRRHIRIGITNLALIKAAAISLSLAADIMYFNILASTCMGALWNIEQLKLKS